MKAEMLRNFPQERCMRVNVSPTKTVRINLASRATPLIAHTTCQISFGIHQTFDCVKPSVGKLETSSGGCDLGSLTLKAQGSN